jgi:hypothetical protein
MKTLAIRLITGRDLKVEIERLIEVNKIQAGVVLSGVGSLSRAKIRLPITSKNVRYKEVGDCEIDSLHGTVSVNGSHLHITVSDGEGHTWGGHLSEGCEVRTTCELIIGILEDKKFFRKLDKDTGFEELTISENAEV